MVLGHIAKSPTTELITLSQFENGADGTSQPSTEKVDVEADVEIEDIPSNKFKPLSSFCNTVKGFAGAGSFALPWAISQAGIWIGTIGLILVALFSNYTMHLLLRCNSKYVREIKKPGEAPPSFADLAKHAYGRPGELFVCITTCGITISSCIAFLILIGENLGSLAKFNQHTIIWFILPVAFILCLIPDMKYLGYTSVFGACALLLAMGTVLAYGGVDYKIRPLSEYHTDYSKVPLWFGVAAFFYCNHIITIPVSHASGDCTRYPKVLNYAMSFITVINVTFALLAYLFFDSYVNADGKRGVPSSITGVLPEGVFASVVRVGIVLELLCSYPIVNAAGLNTVESSVRLYKNYLSPFPQGNMPDDKGKRKFFSRNWKFYVFQAVLNTAMAAIASTISNFGSYTSLIGSLLLATSGFVIPSFIYFKFFPEISKKFKALLIVIIIFGIGATGLGTYYAIDSLIKDP
ncbi:hypothetical protein SAMD00019534_004140 [Acytostelium subglobosum LB1]|uniref:hypothetical protein n=1 Tax=Acytostelium subglobosum LB1 TaxID=1410327 RepID=UPI000644E4CF|nr:hypothetical protein SAMD00019534_004140 [Acytostelium subglobosum LB1]GAM17239.1 hypothetical protein SAMD00019534_004140 [Acytostelium subglobosum LB1]|eukprot:XP_012759301.1 hypothetical protein SAMD00019534_004140 [Acytostelium subglobosum LB1]